ncbi:unnamed protein product [Arabidopsis lyrata]|nr:unnamed protein product [Arabidopsis lyrata]
MKYLHVTVLLLLVKNRRFYRRCNLGDGSFTEKSMSPIAKVLVFSLTSLSPLKV